MFRLKGACQEDSTDSSAQVNHINHLSKAGLVKWMAQPDYYDIYGVANTLMHSLIPLCMSWTKHDYGHPHQRNQRTHQIPGCGPDTLDGPEPEHRHENVDTPVRGVGAARGCGMEREQPCKQRETPGGRYE